MPVILPGVGRLGGHLPTTLRMAARDLARHRSRSAPSVAAVLAAVAGLTFGLTGLASDTEQARREYPPQTLTGEAVVSYWGEPLAEDALRAAATRLVVTENLAARPWRPDDRGRADARPSPTGSASSTSSHPAAPRPAPCRTGVAARLGRRGRAGSAAAWRRHPGEGSGQVLLLPVGEIVRRLGLDGDQADAVRAGAVVARDLPATAVTAGRVTLARGTYCRPPRPPGHDPAGAGEQQVELPVSSCPQPRTPRADARRPPSCWPPTPR